MKRLCNLVGVRIRLARHSSNPRVTLKDLSARMETLDVPMDFSGIAKIERGERAVTDIQVMAFAKALRVSAVWLMGLSEDKHFDPKR